MVQGLDRLRRKLSQKIPEAVQVAAAKKLEERANLIVSIMKSRAPKDQGDLVRSIGWTWGDAPAGSFTMGKVGGREYGRLVITIYAGSEHTLVTNSRGVAFQNAFLQEFGTANMPPTPYFYPSWREKKRGNKSTLTRAIKKAVRDGAT